MTSFLIVGAHPDDETMLAGGTLAMLAANGEEVHILCATRGEGGELGDPPVCERSEAGNVREAELRCAGKALGAISVDTLYYIDPLVGEGQELFAFEAEYVVLVEQLRDAISKVQAQIVLTHGTDGEYGHPAHKLLNRAVRDAVMNYSTPLIFYTWAAHIPDNEDRLWNKSDPADFILDVTPWLDAKETAATCHLSQHGLFRRNHPEAQTIREVLRTIESMRCQYPRPDGDHLADPFAEMLIKAGAVRPSWDDTP